MEVFSKVNLPILQIESTFFCERDFLEIIRVAFFSKIKKDDEIIFSLENELLNIFEIINYSEIEMLHKKVSQIFPISSKHFSGIKGLSWLPNEHEVNSRLENSILFLKSLMSLLNQKEINSDLTIYLRAFWNYLRYVKIFGKSSPHFFLKFELCVPVLLRLHWSSYRRRNEGKKK